MALQQMTFIDLKPHPELEAQIAALFDLGVHYMGISIIFEGGVTLSWVSDDTWGQYYREHYLGIEDPIFTWTLQHSFKVFTWDALPTMREQRKLMQDRLEQCGVDQGITISHRKEGIHEMTSLGFKGKDMNVTNFICTHFDQIINLTSTFRKVAEKLHKQVPAVDFSIYEAAQEICLKNMSCVKLMGEIYVLSPL